MDGLINLDKPAGISSAFAVGKLKRSLPRGTKIGHAGTLDPFATGVLLILIGKATKLSDRLMACDKEYVATMKLGFTTETDDRDSAEIPFPGSQPVAREQVIAALQQQVGVIQQLPPRYSALKIGGRPAYKLARAGRDVPVQPRNVRIDSIELLDFAWPIARISVACGKGTYIRSIARDVGNLLGTGGYLTELSRTRIGPFRLSEAISLPAAAADIEKALIPLEKAVGLIAP